MTTIRRKLTDVEMDIMARAGERLKKTKLFKVTHRLSKSSWLGGAMTVEEACQAAGWKREGCIIRVWSYKGTDGAGRWKKPREEENERTC